MGTVKRSIIVDDETIANLEHCIKRTESKWEPFIDLWPFEIMDIIKQYKEQL